MRKTGRLQSAFPELLPLDVFQLRRLRICCPACFGDNKHCRTCGGHGYVCPNCRGARWLVERRNDIDERGPYNEPVMVRCNGCGLLMTEGWVFDAEHELNTVEAWLMRWQAGDVPDEHAAEEARIASERLTNDVRRQAARVAQHVAWNNLYAPSTELVTAGAAGDTGRSGQPPSADDDLDRPF